jgi:copper chaperone CopZ
VDLKFAERVVDVSGAASVPALVAAVEAAGFTAVATSSASGSGAASAAAAPAPVVATQSTALMVPGMMCLRNCGAKVKGALMGVPGVEGGCLRWQ